MDEELKPYTHAERWQMYTQGESLDAEIFAEMRSNIRLVNGDHYNRRRFNVNRIIQDAEDLNEQQKIRITKNHISKICRIQEDAILAAAPGVGFEPFNKSELADQEAAELHHSVWLAAEERLNFVNLEEEFVEDLCEIGEQAAKVFYDPNGGEIKGYYAKRDAFGNDTDEPDYTRPLFAGELIIENIEPYNLIRPVEAVYMHRAEWLAIRKMVNIDHMKQKIRDPQARALVQSSVNQTYVVYDSSSGGFRRTEKECFLVEMYFRPCPRYPGGHVYFMTREGDIWHDDLPGSEVGRPEFPIEWQKNRRIKGSPRGRSDVKIMRPFQVEINRCASKMAEHHTTVGDDKILLLNGAKADAGIAMPGVRTVNVTGAAPTILQGRDGGQYLATAQSNVSELYQVMQIPEEVADAPSNLDSMVLLFRSAKQKAVHSRHIRRYSEFKNAVVKKYLRLAKLYLPDDAFIAAVGKSEAVNITEFKNSNDMGYEVKVSDQSNDIETKLGQQMMYTQILQYVGGKLDNDHIGMLIELMPYANGQKAAEGLTRNYRLAKNVMLALDRGERPPVSMYEKHPYMIEMLSGRMAEPDFTRLNPEIQMNYQQRIGIHQEFDAYDKEMLMKMEQGMIPTTGYLSKCDLYVPDPENPSKTHRLEIPSDAVKWLVERLGEQGTEIAELESLPPAARSQVIGRVGQQAGPRLAQPVPRTGRPRMPISRPQPKKATA